MQIESVNLTEAKQILEIAIATRANLCFEGNPGIGKTAMIGNVADKLGFGGDLFQVFTGSSMAPEDLAIATKNETDRCLERWILAPIARLNKAGRGLLFLDELTDVPRSVQSAFQRMINERWVGDTKLADGISIVSACNDSKIATGGQDLSWPMIGRITFVRLEPTVKEIANVFTDILAPKTNDPLLAGLLMDYAGALDHMPGLLQLSPPPDAEAGPWAAPRSVERGLTLVAGALARGHKIDSSIVRALLIGSIGRDPALGFLAYYTVKSALPSIDEIVRDPMNAKLPGKIAFAACAGVIAQVGILDSHAGWIYAQRLSDEARLVAGRILIKCPRGKATSPHASAGAKARVLLEAEIGKAQRVAA